MDKRTIILRAGKKVITHTAVTLKQIARIVHEIAIHLHGGDVIALQGELGAGKTTFTQLLAQELGVRERVASPTFVIMKIYSVRNREARMGGIRHLCHIDAYRLTSSAELYAIAADEYIGRHDGITVIEWAERVKKLIPPKAIWIDIQHIDD
ncbi:MAG: tRNA (adenosine(37)-N6)-threonylcarbamoyltransferase complex ATPase subunit type 1 TsaE [Patescibacteria group bacterium]|mgnify:CR=1 FL=1